MIKTPFLDFFKKNGILLQIDVILVLINSKALLKKNLTPYLLSQKHKHFFVINKEGSVKQNNSFDILRMSFFYFAINTASSNLIERTFDAPSIMVIPKITPARDIVSRLCEIKIS